MPVCTLPLLHPPHPPAHCYFGSTLAIGCLPMWHTADAPVLTAMPVPLITGIICIFNPCERRQLPGLK